MKWNRREISSSYFRIMLSCPFRLQKSLVINRLLGSSEAEVCMWGRLCLTHFHISLNSFVESCLCTLPWSMRTFLLCSASQPDSPSLYVTQFIPSHWSSLAQVISPLTLRNKLLACQYSYVQMLLSPRLNSHLFLLVPNSNWNLG